MNFIRRIFNRKVFRGHGQREPKPLRIEGVKTTMTPQPDDAELAAQALLESFGSEKRKVKSEKSAAKGNHTVQSSKLKVQSHDVEYYRQLSERIKAERAAEARLTMRYLAYCEEQLAMPTPLYNGQIGEMERELYKRQTIAEREGGELLRRWQHCLAEVIVRQMSAASEATDYTDDTEDHRESD